MSSIPFDLSKYYFESKVEQIPCSHSSRKNVYLERFTITEKAKINCMPPSKEKALTLLTKIRDHLAKGTYISIRKKNYTVSDVAQVVFDGYCSKLSLWNWIWEMIQSLRNIETKTVRVEKIFHEILDLERNTMAQLNKLLMQENGLHAAIDFFIKLTSLEDIEKAKKYFNNYFHLGCGSFSEQLSSKKLLDILTNRGLYEAAYKLCQRFFKNNPDVLKDIQRAERNHCSYFDLDLLDSCKIQEPISPAAAAALHLIQNTM